MRAAGTFGLDLGRRPRDDLWNDRLGLLAQLTGGRSLPDMVPVLSKAAEWLQRVGDAEDRSLFGAYLDWVKVLLPQTRHAGCGTGHGSSCSGEI